MPRKKIYLEYLKKIPPIKEFLKNSSINDKTLKTYFLALDKFIPFLINRFKDEIEELKDFNLKEYYELDTEKEEQFKRDLDKKGVYTKLIEGLWKELSANTRASLLMKFADDMCSNGFNGANKDLRNTYLNYMWRIQGFLSKLGFEYQGNPKNMEGVKQNGFHLSEEISFEDVVQLYEKMDNTKYKLILKIMMYTGLNPVDIVNLKPNDFKKYRNTKYYVLVKSRIKTRKKDVQYLIVFYQHFIEELTEYFETPKIITYTEENIEKHRDNKYFYYSNEERKAYFQYNWKKDNDRYIFNGTTSTNVIEAFKYHVEKNNLNPEIMSSSIRRLCFTLIKEVFTLKDSDIYNLWTQHKEDVLTRNYITDLVDRTIKNEYIEKISEKVLIGKVDKYIREVKDLKNGMNRIRELENMVSLLVDFIKPEKTIESLESELKEIESNEEYRNKTIESLKGREESLDLYIEDQQSDIEKLKKIEELKSKLKSK